MAIARISDCEKWHREYCELYWRVNEFQVCGVDPDYHEYKGATARMAQLVILLGYTPEA